MSKNIAVNYYTFSPDVVSGYLSCGDWSGCWNYLTEMVKSFSSVFNPNVNIKLQRQIEDDEQKKNLENFGALLGELIFALLSDPSTRIPDKNYYSLIPFHEVIHNLFTLYGVEGLDDVVRNIFQNPRNISETQQKKAALLLNMRGNDDIVGYLKKIDTKYRIPAYISYIGCQSIYDQNVYANKVKLYALHHDLEKVFSDIMTIGAALSAYFNCSYLDIPDRHIVKQDINKAVQRFVQNYTRQPDYKKHLAQNNISRPQREEKKPRMVIVMEFFGKGHAMTRSWGAWIKSLQSEFETVILTDAVRFNPEMNNVFGKVEAYSNLGEFLLLCQKYMPDVLMLPSVGMDFFGVVAANMRIAPLQIMGLGHPATSMSPYIDFVYGPKQMYHPDAFPTDRYIMDNAPYKFVASLSKEDFAKLYLKRREKGDASPLNVAVVGTTLKISAPFLELLKQLQYDADFDIHFSFHLGSVGLNTLCLDKTLSGMFKDYSYTGYKSYHDYLKAFAHADIVLNPFPFGHTNTLIDTMLLGIPCIGLQGKEPASKTESYILDILGYENEFSAQSLEEYKAKFFKMARQILDGCSPPIDRGAVYDRLYGIEQDYDFGKVIKWVYDNRSALLSSEKRVFEAFESLPQGK